MKVFLPLLLAALLLSACSKEEAILPKKDPLQKETSFREAKSILAGPEGIYIISGTSVFLWKDGRKINWLDLSARAEELWDLSFSSDWDTNQLFYIYYRSRGGPSVISEGYDSMSSGSWRRPVIRRPPSAGGSVTEDGKYVLFSDNGNILRIDPYINKGQAYGIPKDNPRKEEIWATLPSGEWKLSLNGKNLLLWGEKAGVTRVWQGSLESIRGRVLREDDFLWKKKDCPLSAGYWLEEGFVFGDCRDQMLLWNGKKMTDTGVQIDDLLSFQLTADGLWVLRSSGDLLLQKRDYPGSAR